MVAPADRLPFDDDSFDTVVVTLVLCTVEDLDATLAEVARVLRPGGRLLFLEHVRAEEPRLARWQDRLERPWRFIGHGCHPNRDTVATIAASPLELERRRARRPAEGAADRPPAGPGLGAGTGLSPGSRRLARRRSAADRGALQRRARATRFARHGRTCENSRLRATEEEKRNCHISSC